MAFIGLCRISCLITNALQKFWTGAFDHVWSYRQHPVFLLPYEWMLHAIEHDNAWCVGMVNTGAVQQSAIGYNHSACGGVDIDCRGQLANRLLGAHGVRQGAVATWYDQGATVGFINIGDGGQYVDGERAPGIQRNVLILVQGLGNPALQRNGRNQRGADPVRPYCLGNNLFNQSAALNGIGVMLYQPFKTPSLVDAAIDILSAGCFLCDSCHAFALSLVQNALVNHRDLIGAQCAVDLAITPIQHVRAQSLETPGGHGQVFVLPVRVLGAGGGVVIRPGLVLPLTPFA